MDAHGWMDEPPEMVLEAAVIVPWLIQCLGAGLSVWKAQQGQGFDTDDAEAGLKGLEVVAALPGLLREDPSAQRVGGMHLKLVVSSFGEAFRRHWYGDPHLAPEGGLWAKLASSKTGKRRRKQIERRTKLAAVNLLEPGDRRVEEDLPIVTSLVGDPMSTPYYRALWDAYVARPSEDEPQDDEPLIIPDKGYRDFERHFRLAYAEGLASPAGESIRRYLMGLEKDRAELVRSLCLRDMASWGSRHVFGLAGEQSELPPMPLGFMYVEPNATWKVQGRPVRSEPVLGFLHTLLAEHHRAVVVAADFGHGKSLSSRMLAWRWAEARLLEPVPSPDQWLPIVVKCAQDFSGHGDDLDKVLRRALWRHANELGLGLSLDDPALALPPLDWRTVVLIDGLDEVSFGERELEALFRRIRERSSEKWCFIIFSRPGVLPSGEPMKGIPLLELQPLTTDNGSGAPGGQVAGWIERWNRVQRAASPMTVERLAERNLLDIASTPILLFMLASIWDRLEAKAEPPPLAEIYEEFFAHIARGKHKLDVDRHPQIAEASEKLCQVLVRRGDVPEGAAPPEAMLWLLSRIAWQAKQLDHAARPGDSSQVALSAFHVEKILKDELKIRESPDIDHTIKVGVLLALQADLAEGKSRILFGHKSFREFLIGRYWERRLWRLLDAKGREQEKVEEDLYGAHLLEREDRSFDFLMELLQAWSADRRRDLFEWAERCFNDEHLQRDAESFRDDQRSRLRLTALAIGSTLGRERGIRAKNTETLRSILGWFWIRGEDVGSLRAPRMESIKAHLYGADLSGADLSGANLRHASLRGADLSDADLSGADLSGASLLEADLSSANLRGANLRGAYLRGADLNGADLNGANLSGANLRHASLIAENLSGAELSGANLSGVHMREAQRDELISANVAPDMLDRIHWLPSLGILLPDGPTLPDNRPLSS